MANSACVIHHHSGRKICVLMAKYHIKLLNISDEQENAIRELYTSQGWKYEAEKEFIDCGAAWTVALDSQSDISSLVTRSGFNTEVLISAGPAETGVSQSNHADIGFNSQCVSVTSQLAVPSSSDATDLVATQSWSPADRRGCEVSGNSNESESSAQCLFCFCSPCVTSARQSWLGAGQAAHARNASIRKKLYRKFWSMMYRRGASRHPLYLQKRENSISRVNPLHVNINREIMPDCILDVVRTLYPNPKGIPYQGHNWW